MWFGLILERLRREYYRSYQQLRYEIKLIGVNAQVYNGKEHAVAEDAHKICSEIVQVFDKLYANDP